MFEESTAWRRCAWATATRAQLAALLNGVPQPFNVNAIAQAAAVAALDDREFAENVRGRIRPGWRSSRRA